VAKHLERRNLNNLHLVNKVNHIYIKDMICNLCYRKCCNN